MEFVVCYLWLSKKVEMMVDVYINQLMDVSIEADGIIRIHIGIPIRGKMGWKVKRSNGGERGGGGGGGEAVPWVITFLWRYHGGALISQVFKFI